MRTLRTLSFFLLTLSFFSSCQKEYSLEGGNLITAPGTWEFHDSTILYRGDMDTAFVETSGTTKILYLQGTSFDGLEDFDLILNTTDPAFTARTYSASSSEANFEYSKNGVLIYEANQLLGEFVVTITSINATNVTGTFTGFANDSLGNRKTITAGKFSSRYDDGTNSGNALGTLGNNSGACTPTDTMGTYTQGVILDTTNKVHVTVNVTRAGIYNISTSSANGVSFSASGTFTTTGTHIVTLYGTGTPAVAGPSNYTVTFGSSTCTFPITYGTGAPPSQGTLGGGPGACAPSLPAGVYTQGIALAASNTITVQANVTTAGAYTISTNTVNGVSFSKSGIFTATGAQNVTLVGTGTPVAAGAQTFTVTYGTSSCTFSITFLPGVAPPTGDYFPTTVNSNWVYYSGSGAAFTDSFKVTATSLTSVFGGQTYTRFHDQELGTGSTTIDTSYYRKTPNNYFEFGDISGYLGFDNPVYAELNFLRDNVAVNGTWNSQNINGTLSGISVTVFVKFTILEKGPVTIMGLPVFQDVIKVRAEIFPTASPTTPLGSIDQWFARGVGLIYFTLPGITTAEVNRYQVF